MYARHTRLVFGPARDSTRTDSLFVFRCVVKWLLTLSATSVDLRNSRSTGHISISDRPSKAHNHVPIGTMLIPPASAPELQHAEHMPMASRPPSGIPSQPGSHLLTFFKPLTPQEKEAARMEAPENAKRNREWVEQKRMSLAKAKEEAKEVKKARVQSQTAERVQRHREKKREGGNDGFTSLSLPATAITMPLSPVHVDQASLRQGVLSDLASVSCPKGEAWKKARNGKNGGAIQVIHERTNWQYPLLWVQIDRAAHKVGWSSTAIVRYLHQQMPELFGKLHAATVWKWLSVSQTGWSAKTLRCVALHGHLGGTGRVGILTPYPDIVNEIKTRLINLRTAGLPVSRKLARSIIISIVQQRKPDLLTTFKCTEVRIYIPLFI